MHELSHCASAACRVSAERAFAFLADPGRLGAWALGCWGATPVDDATVRGTSLFDGVESVVRVSPDPERLVVDYLVGGGEGALRPRITARIVRGGDLGLGDDVCVVTLLAWRTAEMDDERWARLVAAHETEVLLVRGLLERGGAARDER